MPLASTSESSHADRLLVVTGAACGACVALSRIASSSGAEGSSWLMVLIQATVAAQGGAAVLWVVRALLRWLVGRVSGSHAVRDAYMRDDTATYAVFLLTLATAIGVQLVAPVLWLLLVLFAAAQFRVLHSARPRRVRTEAERREGAVLTLLFVSGIALMLYAITWRRLLERQLGASADLSTAITTGLLAGLGLGVLTGWRLARWQPGRLGVVFVALQLAAGLWGAASLALIPRVGVEVAGATMVASMAVVVAVTALPALVMGVALMALVDALPWPGRVLDRSAGWLGAAVVSGAAIAAVVAVDLLFAFAGIRGSLVGSAALSVASAIGAAILFVRWPTADAVERA
ncbi:MAG: hypothetical protein C0497_06950 [Gemmatimonas sp.]|nr:hypothetical protein [Gemmatimonas sp.]